MSRINTLLRLCRYGFAHKRPESPLMVAFHVTTRCNMRCRHCGDDVWGDPANDLPFAIIEKFSADLGKVQDLALGGGEPFLRGDLPEICELFVRNNDVHNLAIPTNGYATELICATVEKILDKCPETNVSLILSLDGFQNTHDSIRMPGSFDRVMTTAHRFAPMREQRRNFNFFFNATINNVNWRELPGLAKDVREKFQTHLDFNLLTGNPRDAALQLPTQAQIKQTIDGIYAARNNSPLLTSQLKICRDVILRTNAEGKQIIPCRAGSLLALVDANGDVRSCTVLPALGNLRQQSFQEIWNSFAARQQHKSIIHGECACNNDCYIVSSLNNYWKLPVLMLQQRLKTMLSKA